MKSSFISKLIVLSSILFTTGCARTLLLHEASESDKGASALEAGDLELARDAYEALDRAYPAAPDIALALGALALDEGSDEDAIQRSKAALADEPIDSRLASSVDPLFRWALRARDQALREQLDERGGRAHHNLGMVHLRRGMAERQAGNREEAKEAFDAAIESFERSLLSRPGDRDTAFNLELALLLREDAEAMEPPPKEHDQESDRDEERDGSDQEANQEDGEGEQERTPPEDKQDKQDKQDKPDNQDEQGNDEDDRESSSGDDGTRQEDEPESESGDRDRDDDRQGDSEEISSGGDPEVSQDEEVEDRAEDGVEETAEYREGELIEPESRDEAERLLRALEANDESLEGHLAKRRASRSKRFVEKDW